MSKSTPEASNELEADTRTAVENVTDSDWERWRSFTAEAYECFHEKLLASRLQFPGLSDYSSVERARETAGTFAWAWGAAAEIQEAINSANAWGMRLHEWGAWRQVVDSYELDEDKWELLYHFVEPIAFFCMFQPSSLADRLMIASEALLHQANCKVFSGEPDRLDQDSLRPGKTLRRSDRRRQLNRLGKRWSNFNAFRNALWAMDGADYQRVTGNFRDLSAHSFAPRLMMGQVSRAIRSVAPLQEVVAQPEGDYLLVDHPTKKCVRYEMGVLQPLPLDTSHAANLAEYKKALIALSAFAALIDELCARMDG
ncbi:MAG: hypothetical protein CVV07_11680 [Gammaproteobacteria bacterium HGW-Gammaproteobacteria-11]|nr:MAG: hypothetical protein CVV07_11680 [Gammaproteobacteria bacterium HGW-Gammaproteobacteria-11]